MTYPINIKGDETETQRKAQNVQPILYEKRIL